MDYKELCALSDKLLLGLTDFYFEAGYRSESYRDKATGGVYENKLAHRLGFTLAQPGDRTPPELQAAAERLESAGHVVRLQRKPDWPELGIWPTAAGLDHAAYLRLSQVGKLAFKLRTQWLHVTVAAITAIVTTIVTSVLKEFVTRLFARGP